MTGKYLYFFILLCFFKVRGQVFVPATLVTFKHDTLRGEAQISAKKPLMQYEKVIFKDANGIQKNYKADKLISYTLDKDFFIALDNDGEARLYKVLAMGAINLYELGIEMQIGNKLVPDKEYYLSYPENKRLVEVKRKKFKKQISDWLKENPAIAANYDSEEFDAEKAAKVLQEFNIWKASKKN
jgi:hypothetical protein